MAKDKNNFTPEKIVADFMKDWQPPSEAELTAMNNELVDKVMNDVISDLNKDSKISIIVHSQEEIDALPENFAGSIIVESANKEETLIFKNLDKASIVLDECKAEVFGDSRVFVLDNSAIVVHDNVELTSVGNSHITAHDNTSLSLGYSEHVDAYDNTSIEANIYDEEACLVVYAHDDCVVDVSGYKDSIVIHAEPTVAVMMDEQPYLGAELLEDENAFNSKYSNEINVEDLSFSANKFHDNEEI